MNIVFLGMGLMGSRMAVRLLAANASVTVWNRTASACDALKTKGADVVTHIQDLSAFDVIAMCLSDDNAVAEVTAAFASRLRAGQIIVDFSSLSVAMTQRLAQDVASYGAHWVDAPVSGGVMGAEQGSLVVFAGGNADVVASLSEFFAPLAQRVSYMGKSGAGQITKICNQLIVASNSTIIAEAIQLATSAGLDATLLAPALAGGFADSKPLQILAPRMATRCFTPVQWKVKTLHKDLNNAAVLAAAHGLSLPVASLAQQQLQQHITQGHADDDLSCIVDINRGAVS